MYRYAFLPFLAAFTLGCSVVNAPDDPLEANGAGGSGAGTSTTGGNAMASTTSAGGGCSSCPDEPNATAECVGDTCEYTCAPGFEDCDMDAGMGGTGCEADLMNDPLHCNSCTEMCDPGEVCMGGSCLCEPGTAQFNATGMGHLGNIQSFVVPGCVTEITIEAFGAQGGVGTDTRGARVRGTFTVTPGETIFLLVGHRADLTGSMLSGGGGTFVVNANNQPLVVAGGGGSCFSSCPPVAETVGRIVTSGGTAGAAPRANNGQGGFVQNATSGAGGGFFGNGANPNGGKSFVSGGLGGLAENFGGYGGGGARAGNWGQGAGGGYSGGSCGDLASTWVGCGGGGSFNAGMNPDAAAGVQMGDGMVVITW